MVLPRLIHAIRAASPGANHASIVLRIVTLTNKRPLDPGRWQSGRGMPYSSARGMRSPQFPVPSGRQCRPDGDDGRSGRGDARSDHRREAFGHRVRTGVVLLLGQQARLDFALELGGNSFSSRCSAIRRARCSTCQADLLTAHPPPDLPSEAAEPTDKPVTTVARDPHVSASGTVVRRPHRQQGRVRLRTVVSLLVMPLGGFLAGT